MKNTALLLSAVTKYLVGLFFFGVLLFLPAGTLFYPGALLLTALLFLPTLLLGVILYLRAPSLLEKRLAAKEKEKTQRGVISASALLLILGFVFAGLDFRFGWTQTPDIVVYAASAVFLVSYGLYAEVLRENAYLSRTVEIQEHQRVIDSGLYGIVRHPMYAAAILLFLSMPLVLGSWISFLCFLPFPVLLIVRIRGEETLLCRELPGYTEYTQRVRWRLLPFLW